MTETESSAPEVTNAFVLKFVKDNMDEILEHMSEELTDAVLEESKTVEDMCDKFLF